MTIWLYALSSISAVLIAIFFVLARKPVGLPPGPPGLPIFGNIFDFNPKTAYKTFGDWGKQYGPVTMIRIFWRPWIIINSASTARELLTKSSNTTSNRFVRPMAALCGFGHSLPHLQPSPRMKETRRYTTIALGPAAMTRYQPEHERRALRLVRKLASNPKDLWGEIRFWVEVGLENVAYGTDDEVESSGFCQVARAAMAVFILCSDPLKVWPVDLFPSLRYVPSWIPGMGFKRRAEKLRNGVVKKLVEQPFEKSIKKMETGFGSPCLVSDLLSEQGTDTLDEYKLDVIKQAAMAVYLGGFDSLTSLAITFYLTMALHPEAQARAQNAVDEVTGGTRLPTFSDRPALPIVDCILKEIIRWGTPLPLVFPHVQDEDKDVVIDGVLIPRGSVIIVNAGAIFEDPTMYPDPMKFSPERHHESHVLDPLSVAFGYARRQCPGMHFVERCMWITIATTLATLHVCPPTDPKVPHPRPKFTEEAMRYPLPFCASFKVRNEALLDL